MPRIAVFATHPIQYQAPWFARLGASGGIDLEVCFGSIPSVTQQGVGFDVPFSWDIPLLDGYRWRVFAGSTTSDGATTSKGRFPSGPATYIRARRPDAAIVTGWHDPMLIRAALACRYHGVPCIVRGESNAMRRRGLPVRTLHRGLLLNFRAFLAIGKSNRDFYLGYGIDPARIFDCPYFVDNDRFAAQRTGLAGKRGELRREWGIPEDATCFLFAGKLEKKKRVLDLLRAIRIAADGSRKLHLLVVGAGELMADAAALSKAEGLPVTFAGFLNQTKIGRAYIAADCLVLPSDFQETWGLVVNEAMIFGLPAIVSDRVGCGPDLVIPGVTGLVFPFGSIADLALAIAKMADKPEMARAMGEAAQTHVGKYSVEATVKGTLEALAYCGAES